MPQLKPVDIQWPRSTFPGSTPQESAGRLINCHAEPLGPSAPNATGWHRNPGLTQFGNAATANTGYRGGLLVNNLGYEAWANNASTVDASGNVTSLGSLPGTKKISIARNQDGAGADVVAVDLDNGAFVLKTQPLANATVTATIGGTVLNAGDIVALSFNNSSVINFSTTVSHTLGAGETTSTIASALTTLINNNLTLAAAGLTAAVVGAVITITMPGANANATTVSATIGTVGGNETITFAPSNTITPSGVGFGASVTATIGGTTFNSSDHVAIVFASSGFATQTVTYILGSGENATTVATHLAALINSNTTLSSNFISASSSGAVITISQTASNHNPTTLSAVINGSTSNESVTFNPASGTMAGGTGTPGLTFTGAPIALSTLTAAGFPQPLSVCWQDGYFFFMSASNELFASNINALTFNALTFVTLQARADVTGSRAVAFSGLLWAFTTGHVELWQDTAQPFPNFPYSRLVVLPYGLLQTNAIDGWETGFDTLIWVSQDFGVWMCPYGSVSPTKISPPDLDRLIEAQSKAGNLFEAYAYIFQSKRFWALSSPAWTWEFNVGAQQWNERWSLTASTGQQGRWRAVGGHPAFGKWLAGDTQSGTLGFVDDTAITEFGAPMLRRMESAPVGDFPNRLRVARADFYFSTGAGIASSTQPNIVNPSVAISWSDDNGNRWSNPIVRSLGLQEKSLRTRVTAKNTGYSGPQARRWRLDDTDCAAPFVRATQSDNPQEY